MKHFNLLSNFRWFTTVILLITLGIGQMWGVVIKDTITIKKFGGSTAESYQSSIAGTTNKGVNATLGNFNPKNGQIKMNGGGSTTSTSSSNFYAYNSSAMPGYITKIELVITSGSTTASYCRLGTSTSTAQSSNTSWANSTASTLSSSIHSWTLNESDGIKYFRINWAKNGGAVYASYVVITYVCHTVTYDGNGKTSGSVPTDATKYLSGATVTVKGNTGSLAKTGYDFSGWNTKADGTGADKAASATFTITQDTTLYAKWAAAASCSANPSIGDASLNGSFNLTTVGVSCVSSGAGTNCTITNYGWVWSDGATNTDPLIDGSGVTKHNTSGAPAGSGGSFTGTLSGSFTVGHTYYYKAYVINGKPATTYSTVQTFIPRSVTFNSNGGSAVDTKYVNSGTKVTAPSDPTKTGYNFGEWQLNSSEFDFANTNVTSNITLVATWTAKTTTVSFNQNSGSGGQTGTLTATYGSAMPSAPVTCPTRTGYDFGGYYDGSGGTGTQYYTSTGASAKNWDKVNSTYTLYAKWTIKNYSVTWKVNGEDYTEGTPTDNVNHGSHVTTLPTAPSTASYCGDKFMGWTDADGGVYTHGTSNLYTKASDFPNATGNQVFYAVFANYVVAP